MHLSLFQSVPSNINRWMCMVLAVLRVLIGQANEEAVLSRLADMGTSIKIYKLGVSPSFRCEKEKIEIDTNDCEDFLLGTTFARYCLDIFFF